MQPGLLGAEEDVVQFEAAALRWRDALPGIIHTRDASSIEHLYRRSTSGSLHCCVLSSNEASHDAWFFMLP
eukprot:CAMPEP_0115855640 /NCGR_PEP_ID=MMETSP0287-20121206/14646_1 /TAXON_ID=412157 /ORGANISM="Chrysochromulina rotalis, Strain UIO044" /LENGTH=70 /DNA_ID=CAMNT_0003309799 /DNA_START=524 /DNA_END=737 /DNA_ORIENTATION=+